MNLQKILYNIKILNIILIILIKYNININKYNIILYNIKIYIKILLLLKYNLLVLLKCDLL